MESYGEMEATWYIRKVRRKLISEHLLCARCVCILGTYDSRGKSVIERAVEVGKRAGNGYSVKKTNDKFRLCTKLSTKQQVSGSKNI